jgi:hypothetical protein
MSAIQAYRFLRAGQLRAHDASVPIGWRVVRICCH